MVALRKAASKPAEVVSVPGIMGGDWTVSGTRVLAETIIAYLRGGYSHRDIFEDYPSLPIDGIDAVTRWAEKTYGPSWMNEPASDRQS